MAEKVTLIPGDGTGPELTELTRQVLDAADAGIEWNVVEIGEPAIAKYGEPLPKWAVDEILKTPVILKGPLTTPIGGGYRSLNVTLRILLDTYAVVRPAKSLPVPWLYEDVPRFRNVDLVIVREATEELYSGVEHFIPNGANVDTADAAESISIVTRKNSERVARFAFEYARKFKRKKVTVVHKANILKATNGLWLKVASEVAKNYPDIQFEDRIVDNMAMQLVLKPQEYDVLLMTNMFGDIESDLASGLIGGLGVAPSSNIGDKYAMFEAVHGSAPKYAGQWKANPTALMLTATLMLRYMGKNDKADLIEAAIFKTLNDGKKLTYDMARIRGVEPVSSKEYTQEIIKNLKQMM